MNGVVEMLLGKEYGCKGEEIVLKIQYALGADEYR